MENINNNETESNLISDEVLIEEEVIQNTAEENNFLKSLGDDVIEGTPVDDAIQLAQGKMTAVGVITAGECMMQQFVHKDFSLDPTQKEHVSDSFAPLFVKYGGELPPWLLQYKEEIAFTFAMGTMCFVSYAQVKALKKIDAEKVINEKGKKESDHATN